MAARLVTATPPITIAATTISGLPNALRCQAKTWAAITRRPRRIAATVSGSLKKNRPAISVNTTRPDATRAGSGVALSARVAPSTFEPIWPTVARSRISIRSLGEW